MTRSMLGTLSLIMLVGACTKAGPSPTTPPGGSASTEPVPGATQPPPGGPSAAPSTSATAFPPAKLTFLEMHKACAKSLEEAWAAHDADKILALYAPNARVASAGPKGWNEAPVMETKAGLQSMMVAFPDAKMKVTRLLSAGENAAIEFTLTGTNQGDLMGEKPTGKPFGVKAASMLVFAKDGKIVHEAEYVDLGMILGQLGKGTPGQKFRPVEPAPSSPLEVLVTAPGEEPKNVTVLKKLYEAFQKRDHKTMSGPFAEDGIISNVHDAADITKADLVKMLPARDKVYVDQGSVVKQCINAGEFAACEYEWTGTWKGSDLGQAPTGKRGTVHELDVARVKDGKIVRIDGYGSSLESAIAFGRPLPLVLAAAKQPPKPEPKAPPKGQPTEPAPKPEPAPPPQGQPTPAPKPEPKPPAK